MKRNSTFVCKVLLTITIFSSNFDRAYAQCVAPSMNFSNPVLITATPGVQNAQYKFPSVIAGVDAYVTITKLEGGATLSNIDDTAYGYKEAWQPFVKTSSTVGESYINFMVEFKDSADGQSHRFNCAQISFIDVDGDNQHVREFVGANDYNRYAVSNVSTITLLPLSGYMKAVGSVVNFPGIDTSAYVTNMNYYYTNKHKISEIRVGNITDPGFTMQDRFSCIYFKQINMSNFQVLPVKYLSFDASLEDKTVSLKWMTNGETGDIDFEIERSFNGNNFSAFTVVSNGFDNGSEKIYTALDNSKELLEKSIVYYRLKQVDINGKINYSNSVAVRLPSTNGVHMSVSPNPFTEKVNIAFNSFQNGNAEISVVSITGIPVLNKKTIITKGYNSLQLDGIASLPAGMYMARLIVNGEVIDKQKIMK